MSDRPFCALCHHEIFLGMSRCLRRSSWWTESYDGRIPVIPVCTHHAKVWAGAKAGDAWPMVSLDAEADLERAMA